jgi:hypothetical protein
MKLTSAAETIIAVDSGASLHKCITELEKDKNVLQRVVDHGIEDYNMMLTGNKKLASEHDKLKHRWKVYRLSYRRLILTPRKELTILR